MAISGFINSTKQQWASARASWTVMNERLARNPLGRAAQRGAMGSVGYQFEGPGPLFGIFGEQESMGFLGLGASKGVTLGYNRARGMGLGRISSARVGFRQIGNEARRAARAAGMTSRGISRAGTMASAKFIGKTAMHGIPLAFTLGAAYEGYQEGGLIGAAKGAGSQIAQEIAFNVGARAIGLTATPLAIGALGIAAAYGTYKFGEAAGELYQRNKRLEMGAPITDRFGTLNTMRQRSLSALQNTHVNGRMALGNEAIISHVPFGAMMR